jgi:hypothetical protein
MPMKKAKQSDKVNSNNNTTSILNDLLSKCLKQSTILNKNMESFASTSTSGGINIPEVQNQQQSDEFDYNQYHDDSILELNELFPNCATTNQIIVSDKSDFDLPQIFEEQTRFSDAVSESFAEFVNSARTKKADVANFIEASQIPSNCKC